MNRWPGLAIPLNTRKRGEKADGLHRPVGLAGAMKVVDMQEVTLVHSGREWAFEQAPCSRDMIRHLERNEGFVTWLQPKGGSVHDQFPVIRTRLGYCTMSLRMMKAVWWVLARSEASGGGWA